MKNSPALIKFALDVVDSSQVAIARRLKISTTVVGAIVHGRARSKRVEREIASVTGMSLADLWPDWYGPTAVIGRKAPAVISEVFRRMQTFDADLPPAA